jgi:hypothetical protein
LDREQAIRIIAQHGWEPDQCGLCDCYAAVREYVTGFLCPSSFDAVLGVKNHYSIEDVRDWLGY